MAKYTQTGWRRSLTRSIGSWDHVDGSTLEQPVQRGKMLRQWKLTLPDGTVKGPYETMTQAREEHAELGIPAPTRNPQPGRQVLKRVMESADKLRAHRELSNKRKQKQYVAENAEYIKEYQRQYQKRRRERLKQAA